MATKFLTRSGNTAHDILQQQKKVNPSRIIILKENPQRKQRRRGREKEREISEERERERIRNQNFPIYTF